MKTPSVTMPTLKPPQASLLVGLLMGVGLLCASLPSDAQAPSTNDLRKQLSTPWDAEDWPAAEAMARQIAERSDSSIEDWRNWLKVLRLQKKDEAALAVAHDLVKRPGANSADHNSICWHWIARNKPIEARPACQKAVELDKANFEALVNLGHSYLLAGDKDTAQAWYRKTLAQIRKEEDLLNGLLDDFRLFVQNRWYAAEAQAAATWFQQAWPQLVTLRQQRSGARQVAQSGKPLEALAQLQAVATQAQGLLGESEFVRLTWITWRRLVMDQVKDPIASKQEYSQAVALAEQAMRAAGSSLPDEVRLDLLSELGAVKEEAELDKQIADKRGHLADRAGLVIEIFSGLIRDGKFTQKEADILTRIYNSPVHSPETKKLIKERFPDLFPLK
ncbi:tetratricopeptide repeat protein [Paucibacter sp. JuS9]|uniref:tetratricopeptide repeat protein n=1 Tax=Paucibacter sp. JuS9 TaxID=3228748 RepID=UPI0037583872